MDKEKYRKLKPLLRKEGDWHKCVNRNENVAIYAQFLEKDPENLCTPYSWVVFRIRRKEKRMIGQNELPAAEVFPNPARFGLDAWQISNKERAHKKYKELVAENTNNNSNSLIPLGSNGLNKKSDSKEQVIEKQSTTQ